MIKQQENRVTMFTNTRSACLKNVSVWDKLPAFKAKFGEFEENYTKLGYYINIQIGVITGASENKADALDDMIEKALIVSGGIHAYAANAGDKLLKESMDFNKSGLKQTRDTISASNGQVIVDAARKVGDGLADYGVTAAVIEELQKAVNKFATASSIPGIAISDRKGAGVRIKKLIKLMTDLLNDSLDKMMEQFKKTAPDFYALYFNSRIIKDVGLRHEAVTTPVN
jgi:hypothetical protein